jgi:hypothetical protein
MSDEPSYYITKDTRNSTIAFLNKSKSNTISIGAPSENRPEVSETYVSDNLHYPSVPNNPILPIETPDLEQQDDNQRLLTDNNFMPKEEPRNLFSILVIALILIAIAIVIFFIGAESWLNANNQLPYINSQTNTDTPQEPPL